MGLFDIFKKKKEDIKKEEPIKEIKEEDSYIYTVYTYIDEDGNTVIRKHYLNKKDE